MPISLTYVAVALLTYLGVEDAQSIVDAVVVLIVAGAAFYGRYRAGGISPLGMRK